MNDAKQVHISFDIGCRPGHEFASPIYRVYIDSDLITERTFIWSSDECVEEHIEALLEKGTHLIKIESVGNSSPFIVNNIEIDHQAAGLEFSIK